MCQASVGRVIGVNGKTVTIKYKGGERILNSKLVDLKVGDYVQFSLNIAVDKIDEEEAKMILGD